MKTDAKTLKVGQKVKLINNKYNYSYIGWVSKKNDDLYVSNEVKSGWEGYCISSYPQFWDEIQIIN